MSQDEGPQAACARLMPFVSSGRPQRARLLSGAEGGLLPPDLEIDPESLRFEAQPLGTGAFGEVRRKRS